MELLSNRRHRRWRHVKKKISARHSAPFTLCKRKENTSENTSAVCSACPYFSPSAFQKIARCKTRSSGCVQRKTFDASVRKILSHSNNTKKRKPFPFISFPRTRKTDTCLSSTRLRFPFAFLVCRCFAPVRKVSHARRGSNRGD